VSARTGSIPPEPATNLEAKVEDLSRRLAQAQADLRAMEERTRELENETVQRGVKLSCARAALARAKIAFDETTRHREQMVQDVAHELRTPLTSIKGAAQNLMDGVAGPLGPDARDYVEIVREHADRLIREVNWLLEALRTTAEALDLDLCEIDLAEVCASVVHGLGPIAHERGLSLTLDHDEAVALVDGDKVRQVIENLISNALKFTERGGSVHVSVDCDSTDVRIRVRDTGVGMDSEELARIFERYYRRYKTSGNSGLGLDISREVVRLHGGEICVQSEPGQGSEFTVRLPRAGEPSGPWVSGCG
jgi:two-component system, OmpR family, phosphate regulon sensor histidine kinase PhoR